MAAKTVLQQLQELEFTEGLSQEQIEKLASLAFEATFAEGQTIFREADVGELIYLIVEGQVAIEIHVPGRGRVTILTLGPGQLLGWSSLLPEGHKTAGARTVTSTHAIAINAAQLRETMQQDHELGCAILWRIVGVVTSRLQATRLQLLDIFSTGSHA